VKSKAPSRSARPRASADGAVRIIGGLWRRSKLPVADKPGLRPTPDRVRETLFNWLGQDLAGWRVLDAFAGSGALGFEAASRGSAEVVLIERDAALARSLRESAQRLGAAALRVEVADAIGWMSRGPRQAFDLALIDPPFDSGLHGAAIEAATPLLKPGGWLYVEAPQPLPPTAGFDAWRASRAGAVHFQLWRRLVS
jgi:16S rRNA (guanine966-N2)-methyltransferase